MQACLCCCRRAYTKCPAQLKKAGRSEDAALFNTHFDVDQISDNCRFRYTIFTSLDLAMECFGVAGAEKLSELGVPSQIWLC